VSLWQEHEPDLTELGKRAEFAMRMSFMSEVSVSVTRHDPDDCACYLLPMFFNHKTFDACDNDGHCPCVGCVKLRKEWTGDRALHRRMHV
jgi:hypothetical protein